MALVGADQEPEAWDDSPTPDARPEIISNAPKPQPPPPPASAAAAPKARPSAAERARAAYQGPAAAQPQSPPIDSVEAFQAARELDLIAELEALTSEIHLVSPDLGDIFLVKEHTGQARTELTFREAAALRRMVDQFPGARVVALRPGPPKAAEEGWDA